MELHQLKPAKGSVKERKRVGRGQGSGRGGTSTRGHKGDKSRSGHKIKRGYEGGQLPIHMRIPKRGFHSRNRVEYVPLNLDQITMYCEKYGLDEITLQWLYEKRILRKNERVKVLGRGEINKPVKIEAHKCSETAKKAIEAAGGTVTIVD